MYTGTVYSGTLISGLMETVEHVERAAEQRRVEVELHEIFTMQIAVEGDQAFMGAA